MLRSICATLAAAVLAAGCGGSSSSDETAATATATATATTTAAATPAIAKPRVEVPGGKAPKRLVVTDLRKGTGRVAKDGSTVSVQYVGVHFTSGNQFDASWDRGEPFSFQLGTGGVIPGWDQGVKGMREGGRRRLVIPPDLAYGPQGQPPTIGPNETLVFVIDLLSVK